MLTRAQVAGTHNQNPSLDNSSEALTRLKLKAQESVRARRAQTIQSPSFEPGKLLTDTTTAAAADTTITDLHTSTVMSGKGGSTRNSYEREVNRQAIRTHFLVPHQGLQSISREASLDLDDLFAEERAAAQKDMKLNREHGNGVKSSRDAPGMDLKGSWITDEVPETIVQANKAPVPTLAPMDHELNPFLGHAPKASLPQGSNGMTVPTASKQPSKPDRDSDHGASQDSHQGNVREGSVVLAKHDINGIPQLQEQASLGIVRRCNATTNASNVETTDQDVMGQQDWTLEDIEDWLDSTGFYDVSYRKKKLDRLRRMRAIDAERNQLLLEEQEESTRRAPSTLPSQPLSASLRGSRATAILAMPPPAIPASTRTESGLSSTQSIIKSESTSKSKKLPIETNEKPSLKRVSTADDVDNAQQETPAKLVRRNPDKPKNTQQTRTSDKSACSSNLSTPQVSKERFESMGREARNASDSIDREPFYNQQRRMDRDRRQPRQHREDYRDARQECHLSEGGFDRRHAGDLPVLRGGGYNHSRRSSVYESDRSGGNSLDLRASGIRYFIVRSWTMENIAVAQTENSWCTQTKNEDLLVHAFRHSRHVILVFSANNSKAFQGFARMQTLPGDPTVRQPSWRKRLHWPTTEPFGIRWLTKTNVSYHIFGELKNPWNENLPVFVARDGQEIPERIGAELCEMIDEEAQYQTRNRCHLDY